MDTTEVKEVGLIVTLGYIAGAIDKAVILAKSIETAQDVPPQIKEYMRQAMNELDVQLTRIHIYDVAEASPSNLALLGALITGFTVGAQLPPPDATMAPDDCNHIVASPGLCFAYWSGETPGASVEVCPCPCHKMGHTVQHGMAQAQAHA